MAPKSIFASKTFWFNVIATTLDILAFTQAAPQFLPPTWAPYLSLAQGIGNILLRRLTASPVTWGPASSPASLTDAQLEELDRIGRLTNPHTSE